MIMLFTNRTDYSTKITSYLGSLFLHLQLVNSISSLLQV